MEEVDVARVETSFRTMLPMADTLSDTFYTRLFELEPEVRALFSDDIAKQRTKFVQTLAIAVSGLRQVDTLAPALTALGRRHAGYRVEERHYHVARSALLDALAQCHGRDFTPELRAAWAATYDLLATVMIEAQRGTA